MSRLALLSVSFRILAFGLLFCPIFEGRTYAQQGETTGESLEKRFTPDDVQVQLLLEAYRIIQSQYVDELDSKDLIYAAIQGMLTKTGPGNYFVSPKNVELNRFAVAVAV